MEKFFKLNKKNYWLIIFLIIIFLVLSKFEQYVVSISIFVLIFLFLLIVLFFLFGFRNSPLLNPRKLNYGFKSLILNSFSFGIFLNFFTILLFRIWPLPLIDRSENVGNSFLGISVGGVDFGWICYAYFLGPILEEIIFRKYLLILLSKKNVPFAPILISFVFVFIHPIDIYKYVGGFITLFAISMQLNYLYRKTGKLIYPIILHISYNLSHKLLLPIFFDKRLSVNFRDNVVIIGTFFFLFLTILLNRYLFNIDARMKKQKSDIGFNLFCYGAFALYLVLYFSIS